MRNGAGRKIACHGFDGVTGELGAQVAIGEAGKIGAKIFAVASIREIWAQKWVDGSRNFPCRAAKADGASEALVFADGTAEAEIVGVNELVVELDFFAFEADVRNPVLAASIRAAGDVELERLVEGGDALF